MIDAPFTVQEMHDVGYSALEMSAAGFSLRELAQGGYSVEALAALPRYHPGPYRCVSVHRGMVTRAELEAH